MAQDGRRLLMRHAALLALVCTAAAAVLAQAPGVSLAFVAPVDGGYTSGPTTIRIQVDPPGAPVTSVSLFADGRLVCTLDRAPFECAFDAGPKVIEHALRAVATLPGGRRVVSSIRTRGVEYTESVDVDVVQVTVTVTDDRGQFVRGLKRQDFRLSEDNAAQDLTTFIAENVPLELIVAVDVSGSMTDAMPKVFCLMDRAVTWGDAEDHVKVVLSRPGRPTIDLEISSCNPYNLYTYQVWGTQGGLTGTMDHLEWKWFDPAKAPEQHLIVEPLPGPSYCTETLPWQNASWDFVQGGLGMFDTMAKPFYENLHAALTEGAPLAVPMEHVRLQIAVIEECHRQNRLSTLKARGWPKGN